MIIKRFAKIFYKVRKHGLIESFRIMIYHTYKFGGFCHRLVKLIFVPYSGKKRILGIWDYKALPWSVGDPLVFIEKLSILKIKHNTEEIDICIIYDRKNPGGNRRERNITPENSQDYSLDFLPLFSTCPYLGSIYQFNSRDEFYRFLKMNLERYDIFPSLSQYLSERYNFIGGEPHLNEIQEFYDIYGYIPYLRIGERENFWAKRFYLNYLPENTVPITLSLRQLKGDPERNAEPSVWLSFIDMCKTDFPEVVFVVVGLREEIFSDLKNRSNVIIAKDFGTSLIEDLTLIRTSLMYMGPASGINVVVLFSDLPYIIFQSPNVQKYGLKRGENFSFATNLQKTFDIITTVTPRLLLDEFKKLYSQLDRNKWLKETLEKARNKRTHHSGISMLSSQHNVKING